MDIAVIGASGDVGRTVATRLVGSGVLERHERLQLVGRRGGRSEQVLAGFTVDLLDAFAERAPVIDIALDPSEIAADIIILAAGRTVSVDPRPDARRESLAKANAEMFHAYAEAIARNGSGHELVVVVSNPVELAVEVFARKLGRQRVFGMAAYLDSLRFRKEIARDLRLSRRAVHGFIAGEHGDHLVPLWSTVHVFGLGDEDGRSAVERVRRGTATADFVSRIAEVKARLAKQVARGEVREALRWLDTLPPDIRVGSKPFLAQFSGAKTSTATAEATVEFVATIHGGHDAMVSGQILLEGEYGIRGPIGVPFVLSFRGVEEVVDLDLEADELRALRDASAAVRGQIEEAGA